MHLLIKKYFLFKFLNILYILHAQKSSRNNIMKYYRFCDGSSVTILPDAISNPNCQPSLGILGLEETQRASFAFQ